MTRPAILGGAPAFPDGLPFVRPAVPPLDRVAARVAPSYDRGILTNGPLVRELEATVAARLGVDHVVAVSSCTAGLMLAVLAIRPRGPVLLPSFTFSASAHALAWNGIEPRFAECDPATFQLDLDDASTRLDGAGAILATHVFGAPCAPPAVEALGRAHRLPVLFDAAHGFGATCGERPLGGFGTVEVFSLTPTKPLVAGEGGLVATNDAGLADTVRLGRDYGNPGDYDTRFAGLNARMSEVHAATALESLERFPADLDRRRTLAARYASALAAIPGIRCQAIDAADRSTFKDFTIAIDEDEFGLPRDNVVEGLRAEGIDTRCYFSPPVHRQQAYARVEPVSLPATDRLASQVVSLPIWVALADEQQDRVVAALVALHDFAGEIRTAV